MGAVAASFDMTAEGGGAAGLDGAHRLELFERESAVLAVRLAVATEDIGQLKAGPGHASGFGFGLGRAAGFALGHRRWLGSGELVQRRGRR